MVFSALFLFQVHIHPTKLLEEKTEQFKIIRKFIMAAQKCKNKWSLAALKDF